MSVALCPVLLVVLMYAHRNVPAPFGSVVDDGWYPDR